MKNDLITTFSPRQYMLSEDFEIYYYSDTELMSVPNHTHSYYEFYFFLEGEVDMLIQGKSLPLSYGDLLVIPPGVPHHALMKSKKHPYRRFVFWISTDFMNGLRELSPDYDYLFKCMEEDQTNRFHFEEFVFGQLQSKVFELLEETFADRFGKAPKVSLCVSALLLHINRAIYEQHHVKTPEKEDNLYRGIVQYIENHIDEDLSLDLLADAFFVSKFHISHLFKENMGISTHQFILKKRLSMCREAILEGAGIGDTCSKYGFSDYSVFYRAFRKDYGVSPKKLRDEIQRNYLSGTKETIL